MQVKLLRLIESGTFRRVGGVEVLRADFRLVAATHKPLKAMIGDGRFRPDLYYRISAYPISLPAVRERPGDMPLLVDSILRRIAALGPVAGQHFVVAPDALARLEAYAWPGNIRELRNVLDRACLLTDDGVIRVEHLPDEVAGGARIEPGAPAKLSDDELARIARAFGGTRRALAERVGMSERTLYRRLRALGIATREA
ncbi:sensory box sigma-54 dependent transcriptional regulator [Burkholderia pseudomallei]|nr:sigma 54-interacting transcriptional regulator [Burkholderia pseudomallei]CFK97860.1 sensory box sigma-54 dependent transcriptional regulator [Burkholderia pseudomallei]